MIEEGPIRPSQNHRRAADHLSVCGVFLLADIFFLQAAKVSASFQMGDYGFSPVRSEAAQTISHTAEQPAS
jgi:hypothetical protein